MEHLDSKLYDTYYEYDTVFYKTVKFYYAISILFLVAIIYMSCRKYNNNAPQNRLRREYTV